jgi:hypothetical protein
MDGTAEAGIAAATAARIAWHRTRLPVACLKADNPH